MVIFHSYVTVYQRVFVSIYIVSIYATILNSVSEQLVGDIAGLARWFLLQDVMPRIGVNISACLRTARVKL